MIDRSRQIFFQGKVESRDAAFSLLKKSGDAVIVERGHPRLLIMRCPCGCGDDLLINLDRRAGPAWRLYLQPRGLTLYPSYWRDSACGSHFIVWNSNIFWCSSGIDEEIDESWDVISITTENMVFDSLPENKFVEYTILAESLNLTPWETLQACRQLVRKNKASSNKKYGDKFQKMSFNSPQQLTLRGLAFWIERILGKRKKP